MPLSYYIDERNIRFDNRLTFHKPIEEKMNAETKDIGFRLRGVLVVVGGIFVHLSIGSYYTFGNISPYIISYLRNRTDEVNLRNVDGLWITAIGGVGNCAGMFGGGVLDKIFGPRIATAVGSLVFSGAIALTSLAVQRMYIYVVITYGVIMAVGLTMAYGPTVQTSIKWFPNHPSLVAGLVVAGFGGGPIIFNQVITNYINPNNLPPDLTTDDGERYFTDPDLLDRVPKCFLILAGAYSVLQIIGIIMITTPPRDHKSDSADKNIYKEGIHSEGVKNVGFSQPELVDNESHLYVTNLTESNGIAAEAKHPETKQNIKAEYTVKEAVIKMFKSQSFYITWFTALGLDSGMQFILGLYKAYGQTFIDDDHFLALVGSISAVFNCLGRPLWGIFIDRFRYKVSMCCISAGLTVMIGTLFTTESTGKPGFFIWICLIYLFFCGIWAVLASTLSKLFGASNMAINYGFIEIALGSAQAVGGVFAITLKSKIGWKGLFFAASGMAALRKNDIIIIRMIKTEIAGEIYLTFPTEKYFPME